MGRKSTGVWTADKCLRLELPFLWKNRYFKKGSIISGSISWTNGSWISFKSCYKENEKWLQLIYTIKNSETGCQSDHEYKINLTEVPSNLGKGMIPYFICPVLNKQCRILYGGYDNHIWKCREAYKNKVVYSSQICSKKDYANIRYWAIQKRIDEMLSRKYKKFNYKDKPTRFSKLLEKLLAEKNHWDKERWKLKNMHIIIRKKLSGLADDETILN